jgi:hypothetical protein
MGNKMSFHTRKPNWTIFIILSALMALIAVFSIVLVTDDHRLERPANGAQITAVSAGVKPASPEPGRYSRHLYPLRFETHSPVETALFEP